MSPCSEIQARAAYLAALPKEDPASRFAFDHARGCSACEAALAEGERTLALVDRLPLPPPPTEFVLKQASEPILRELEAQRGPSSQAMHLGVALIWATSIVAGWCVAVTLAKHRAEERASWLWSAMILSVSLLGLGGIIRFQVPVTAAVVAISGILSAVLGREGGLFPAVGVKCVAIELIAASLPLMSTALLALRDREFPGAWRFSAAAALGALAGQAGLHLTCPVASARLHLIAFHTGGVLLATLLGLAVATTTSRALAKRRS